MKPPPGKSIVTVDVLKDKGYEPLAYRYLCLGAHYRTQLEFSYESMDSATKSLKNLRAQACGYLKEAGEKIAETQNSRTWKDKFTAAMQDDLNAPKALAVTWEALKSDLTAAEKVDFLRFADSILAIDVFKAPIEEKVDVPAEVVALLEQRQAARVAKDWAKSDALRNAIASAGYIVKDTPQGQQVTKK